MEDVYGARKRLEEKRQRMLWTDQDIYSPQQMQARRTRFDTIRREATEIKVPHDPDLTHNILFPIMRMAVFWPALIYVVYSLIAWVLS
jgi:hypothetical protein